MEPYAEITSNQLKARLDAGEAPALLDVREPWEHDICALPGARLVPMDQLSSRLAEIDPERELIVYCHHGMRAAAVVEWLRAQGVPAVNLRGGIDAWAVSVDRSLRRY